MNGIIKAFIIIISNRTLHKFLLLLIINLTIFALLVNSDIQANDVVFFFIFFLLLVSFIYLYILSFKILYEITSINQFQHDIGFSNFFFKFMIYQILIGFVFILPFSFLYNIDEIYNFEQKLKQIPKLENISIFLFQELFYIIDLIGSIILIGSRSFTNLFIKLEILFSTKIVYLLIFFQIFSWIAIGIYQLDSNYTPFFQWIYKITKTIILLGFATAFFLSISEFQRKYFNKINSK
ncbi:hypothetical protein CH381_25415 [Leptospira sp. mixed culture ATI2-C-A1]|nr:hypothetical protein CH381_25415 [Leptospira sp. mixed culture ATI2-C-A1]